MNVTVSKLEGVVTKEVAKRLADMVFEQKTSWEKEGPKYNVDGAYLRRYCKDLLMGEFKSIEHSGLTTMTLAGARKLYADVASKKTSWTAEGKKYGVSDVAVRKRCKLLLWDEFKNIEKVGVRMEFDCSECWAHFSRMSHEVGNLDADNFFCKPGCQRIWQQKNLRKWPKTGEELYEFYKFRASKGDSLRAMARELGMTHDIFMRHLHMDGIRPSAPGAVKHDGLKPFVRKYPAIVVQEG